MSKKYLTFPITIPTFKRHLNPPYSLPSMPEVRVFDNVLELEGQKAVYEYLLDQPWHQAWPTIEGEIQVFKPSAGDESWVNSAVVRRTVNMPRCVFASDESSLQKLHPLIWDLWTKINNLLDNKYEITGHPEGMYFDKHPIPEPADSNLSKGWRVYANATMHDMISMSGFPHRDTPKLEDDTTVTILYVANPTWYPSWGGEIQFFPEDPDGLTGDHQQFNQPDKHEQSRNYNVGWADEGKQVSLKPNRLIVYDGRTLHLTNPSRRRYNSELSRRVVFRARLKK